jgi:hypothetical protein
MDLKGRNTVWGIRDRTLKNLAFLKAAGETKQDVHRVTNLVTSLLGLIVFPYEEIKSSGTNKFGDLLVDLTAKGWPDWQIEKGSCRTLDQLIRRLRNAISHRHVYFSSDDRDPSRVDITFKDMPPEGKDWTWIATINAVELERFAMLFADYLKAWESDLE